MARCRQPEPGVAPAPGRPASKSPCEAFAGWGRGGPRQAREEHHDRAVAGQRQDKRPALLALCVPAHGCPPDAAQRVLPWEVAAQLGHSVGKEYAITERYAFYSPDYLSKAVEALDALIRLVADRPVTGQSDEKSEQSRSSSGVEQRIRNAWVGGSNPSCGTSKIKHFRQTCAWFGWYKCTREDRFCPSDWGRHGGHLGGTPIRAYRGSLSSPGPTPSS
jgi:hypothetical protein